MSEGFPFPGKYGDGDGDGDESVESAEAQAGERLHTVMTKATAHLGAVRVDPARLRRAQRRHRLSEGGVVAGVLSVALVAATIAMQGGGGGSTAPAGTHPTRTPTTTASSRPTYHVIPRAVSVYDSDDGAEGKDRLDGLHIHTPWQTYQYCQTNPVYNGVHKGTGLVFDLGTATRLGTATVSIGTPGASLEMWAADSTVGAMPAVLPGRPPAGFTKVATITDAGSKAVLSPAQPVTTRFVLVWFTNLPTVPNPDTTIHCAHNDSRRYGDSISAVDFTVN